MWYKWRIQNCSEGVPTPEGEGALTIYSAIRSKFPENCVETAVHPRFSTGHQPRGTDLLFGMIFGKNCMKIRKKID